MLGVEGVLRAGSSEVRAVRVVGAVCWMEFMVFRRMCWAFRVFRMLGVQGAW